MTTHAKNIEVKTHHPPTQTHKKHACMHFKPVWWVEILMKLFGWMKEMSSSRCWTVSFEIDARPFRCTFFCVWMLFVFVAVVCEKSSLSRIIRMGCKRWNALQPLLWYGTMTGTNGCLFCIHLKESLWTINCIIISVITMFGCYRNAHTRDLLDIKNG